MPQFFINAHDYTDTDALNRRLANRDAHLQRISEYKAKGNIVIGGAKLNQENKMIGSMLVVDFPDMESTQEWISNDPYIKGKVWGNIEVTVFKAANV